MTPVTAFRGDITTETIDAIVTAADETSLPA